MKRRTILHALSLALLLAACGGADVTSPEEAVTSDEISTQAGGAVSEDSYVSSQYPSNKSGSLPYLKVGTATSNQHHSYLKVIASAIPAGATGIEATLTVHALKASANAIHAHCGNASSWTEAAIDWKNQPGFAATDADSVGSVAANTNVTFDVSSCVTGNGTFTVVLDQPTGPVTEFASTESATNKPTLTVSFTPAATRAPIIFGMFNNTAIAPGAEVNTSANYVAIRDRWMVPGKLKVHRVFDSTIPASYAKSGGADDPANGLVSFLSVKPPSADFTGVASGKYDTQIATLAKTIPAGSYFTMFHEPENDMTGPQFVAMFKRFYKVAKAANPQLSIGYVAMSYQWRPGSATTANEDSWWPGADSTDFLGADAYDNGAEGAHSLDGESDFQRWYAWAKPKNKPMVIPEYGVQALLGGKGYADAQRAQVISGTMTWLQTQPNIKMLLYWDGTQATPGGLDHILNPTTTQPADVFSQARAAWNAGVTQYGSIQTTF